MFDSVKGFFGYGSPKGLNYEPHRFEREESPTQSRKRGAEPAEVAESKRMKVTEQITTAADAGENTSPKERSSMDSRRKESVRGKQGLPAPSMPAYQCIATSRTYKSGSIRFTSITIRTAGS
jgi:hypothetical protein